MTEPGGTYRAGTVFVPVIPSFEDFHALLKKDVADKAREIGRQAGDKFGEGFDQKIRQGTNQAIKESLGKSSTTDAGKAAGEQAGANFSGAFRKAVESAGKTAANALGKEVNHELDRIAQELDRVKKLKIGVDLSSAEAVAKVRALSAELEAIVKNATDIEIKVNAYRAQQQLKAFEKMVDDIARKGVEVPATIKIRNFGQFEAGLKARVQAARKAIGDIEVGVNTTAANRELAALATKLDKLEKKIGVNIDASQAEREIKQLALELALLSDASSEITVKVDALEASTQLAAIEKLRERIDGRRARIIAEVKNAEQAKRQLESIDKEHRHVNESGSLATASFRTFSGAVLGLAALGPLIIPFLGGMATGLIAIGVAGPIAAAGLGTLLLGLFGIGEAVSAMRDVERDAGRDLLTHARTMRSAANAVRDAQTSLSRAREAAGEAAEAAARQVEDATDRQLDAERDLADAQRDARRAQDELTEARERAADQLEDLTIRVAGGALAERRAVLALARAQMEALRTARDPFATSVDREEADIGLRQARLDLEQVRLQNGRLAEEKAKADALGVDGTDTVIDAQQRLQEANERVVRSQEAVVEAAEGVQDALVAQARSARDSARAIEDAQLRLHDAQLNYQDALIQTAEVGSASMRRLEDAMERLSPAGRAFATFIFGLRDEFQAIRDIAQAGLLPGVQKGLEILLRDHGPKLTAFIGTMSTLFGNMFVRMAEGFSSPQWQAFFDTFAKYAPIFTAQAFQIFMNLGEAFANLWRGFAPFTEDVGAGLVAITRAFADWTAQFVETEAFQEFLDYLRVNGPKVGKALLALVLALTNLAIALAPFAEDLLGVVTGFLNLIAAMDPDILGPIVIAIIGIALAIQMMTLIMSAAGAIAAFVTALLAGATAAIVAAVVGALILVGFALYLLWQRSETFREIVLTVFRTIREAAKGFADFFMEYVWPVVKGAFDFIVDYYQWMWEHIWKPITTAIGFLFWALWVSFLEPVFRFVKLGFEAWFAVVSWFWTKAFWPIIQLIGKIVWELWDLTFSPVFDLLKVGWELLWTGMVWVYDNIIKPMFDTFMKYIGEDLVNTFQRGVITIGEAWDSLIEFAKKPIRFVVETVINKGLIDPFNTLARFFGTTEIPYIRLPASFDSYTPPTRGQKANQAYAGGGLVDGWSPNDTADNIFARLTAKEYVIRRRSQERMSQLFPGLLDYINAYGTLPGFADGGLVDFGRDLQRQGYRVTGHSAFGGREYGLHGRTSLHYVDKAIDVNWAPGTSLIEQQMIDKIVPHAIARGLRVIWRVADHFNHAHFDTGEGRNLLGKLADIAKGAAEFATRPVQWLRDQVEPFISQIGDHPYARLLASGARRVVDWAVAKVLAIVEQTGEFLFGNGDAATGPVWNIIQDVAAGYGWHTGIQWNALQWLINKESGGNPRAQNPNSTAFGLFQFLNSTWSTVGATKTSDPRAQTVAGLRYIEQRYGTPEAAAAFHRKMGWYSEGGVVEPSTTPVGIYDTGGIVPPGLSAVLNLTGENERAAIVNPEQWEALERIANGEDGGDTHINVGMMPSNSTPEDVAAAIAFRQAVHRRGGVAARRKARQS